MFKSTVTALALLTTSGMAFADTTPMSVDVAEDITRFIFAEKPVFEDGMPAYGNAFVTQSYIYEDGTLDSGIEGTLADINVEAPRVITGGTGAFEGLTGEMKQVLLGIIGGYGVRLLIDVKPEEHASLVRDSKEPFED